MKKNIYTVLCITLCQFYFSCNLNVEPLIMGYWNVENLFDLVDDPEKNDDEFSIGGRKNVTEDIYKLKLTHTAEVLADLNADVVGLSEVENELVIKDLIEKFNSINLNINDFNSMNYKNKNSIFLVENLPINLLAHFIINSKKNFSFHGGPIIHISSAYDMGILTMICLKNQIFQKVVNTKEYLCKAIYDQTLLDKKW